MRNSRSGERQNIRVKSLNDVNITYIKQIYQSSFWPFVSPCPPQESNKWPRDNPLGTYMVRY